MKVSPTKVVILSVGDQQYPQDLLGSMIKRVQEGVRSLPSAEVVCECTIMNDADADAAVAAVAEKHFDAFIVDYVSWHITPYVMRVLKNYPQIPVMVWGIGGCYDETGKLIAPASGAGTTALIPVLKEFGYKYMLVQEKPAEELRLKDADRFLRVVGAMKAVRNSRIGLYGYADMGLFSCSYNRPLAYEKLGIDIEDYAGLELQTQMAAFSDEEVAAAVAEIKADMVCENVIKDEVIARIARLYLVMKGKKDQRGLDAISIKCVFGVNNLGFNACLAQSLLANKDTSVICECDAYGLATGIMLSRVTGQCSAFVENYEAFDDTVLVGVCGFIPKDMTEGDWRFRSANLGEYNTGISNVSRMKLGQITYGRLYESKGQYKMFLARGEAKDHIKWTEAGWNEPTPDFPSFLLDPGMSVQHYLENVPGQHILFVYGDYLEDMKLFCKFMGIEVVD